MTFILPKKTKVLWQLRTAVAFLIVFFAVLLIAPLNMWTVVFEVIIFIVVIVLAFIYIHFFVKNYKIITNNKQVYINKGVFIKSLTVLPQVRMVFVKNFATPLMSLLKLEIIMLKVAKGWIFIPEMDRTSAEQLLRQIHGDIK